MDGGKIRDRLARAAETLTPSEERIMQVLLHEYPTSGLGSASALARRAGVSDPTVLRLVAKLGFQGFSEFQQQLLVEVEAQLHSPLMMMEAKRLGESEDAAATAYLRDVSATIARFSDVEQQHLIERAAKLLLSSRGDVYLLGGRFSRHLAGMLAGYLTQFRPGIRDLGEMGAGTIDRLLDFGRTDLLIVFDYRRYQNDVLDFARQAAARGTRIMLFTDPWMSPLSAIADITLTAPVEARSAFDTMAPALAQVEAFTAHIVRMMDDTMRERIEKLEELRLNNRITADAASDLDEDPQRRSGPGPK